MKKRKIALALLLLFLVAASAVIVRKRLYIWLPGYIAHSFHHHPENPTDVIVLICDHFEPGTNTVLVERWAKEYPSLLGAIRDSDNRPPQHTFFYPAEQFDDQQVEILNKLVRHGFGEIELHLHHNDPSKEAFRQRLTKAISDFQRHGALVTEDGKTRFAFVHGNWALDNSVKDRCGVDDEISQLLNAGSFADFTFPAYKSEAQPAKIDSIYYAVDDPNKPKSYNGGIDAAVGKQPPQDGYLIFTGPLGVRSWFRKDRFVPTIDYASLEADSEALPDPSRLDTWLKADIHVLGRPEWIFVKLHTHGAATADHDILLSGASREFWSGLVRRTREKGLRIHFVTAREAYNMVKAAEAGRSGNPYDYRDFVVPRYKNQSLSFGTPQP